MTYLSCNRDVPPMLVFIPAVISSRHGLDHIMSKQGITTTCSHHQRFNRLSRKERYQFSYRNTNETLFTDYVDQACLHKDIVSQGTTNVGRVPHELPTVHSKLYGFFFGHTFNKLCKNIAKLSHSSVQKIKSTLSVR